MLGACGPPRRPGILTDRRVRGVSLSLDHTSVSGGRSRLGPGIDVRGPGRGGRGGYLVGPGSVVGGGSYVIALDVPIQLLPDWLTELCSDVP